MVLLHDHDHPYSVASHLESDPLELISGLVPYSGVIFSSFLIGFFLLKHYLFEPFLLPKLYGDRFAKLSLANRRTFVNHHLAGSAKIVILIVGAYPFVSVFFLGKFLKSPFASGSRATMGDVLVVVGHLLTAMYAFELIYRLKISPISIAHHIGTILIGQTAMILSLSPREVDAVLEFLLCLVWGVFDIISEFYPHVAIVLYRLYPDNHRLLRKVFRVACFSTLFGTTTETVMIFVLFGSLWHKWTIEFKILTPILHCIFTAAQLHGSRVFWEMYKKEDRLYREVPKEDIENASSCSILAADTSTEAIVSSSS
ncbi:hypothetical protein C8J56DRAFT_960606 [Mycena floridula]|nr:hypothetical protein C8J56DRAFT_960606 [Mycena floridula]